MHLCLVMANNLHILHQVDSKCTLLKYYEEHHGMDHPGTKHTIHVLN